MRIRSPIPAPPDPRAAWFTLDECAGYLRIRRRSVDELRRDDPEFRKLVSLVLPGAPRVSRARLDAWLAARPTGWSTTGGTREGAFVSKEAR